MGHQSAVLIGELARRQNAGKTYSRVLLSPVCSTGVARESEAFLIQKPMLLHTHPSHTGGGDLHSQACCEDGTMCGEGWGKDDGYLGAVWSLFCPPNRLSKL